MTLMHLSSNNLFASKPFRIFVLTLGIGLFVVFGMMLIPVSVNLPDSWMGLLYVVVGLTGATASVRYYFTQRRILLIPILAATLLITTILVGTLLFGHGI